MPQKVLKAVRKKRKKRSNFFKACRRMKLIVGLGNPGKAYTGSRHNIGFTVLTELADSLKINFRRAFLQRAELGKCGISGEEIILAKPVTFMNLSGAAVAALLRKYRLDLKDLLVICDDLDLELGRIKIRKGGSSGGHQGLQSIIERIGSSDFARLRVGISRPIDKEDVTDYVLSNFKAGERARVKNVVSTACECAKSWITEKDIDKIMNTFNRRSV